MTVRAEHCLVRVRHAPANLNEEFSDLVGGAVADRVRQIDRRRADVDRLLDHAAQKVHVGPRRIFGGELDIVGVATCLLDAVGHRFEALVSRDPQLALEVKIRGGDKGVEPRPSRRLDRLARPFDIGRVASGQSGDDRGANLFGDQRDGLCIVIRRNREPRLDDVNPKRLELSGERQLLLGVHREPGRLLSIA